MPSIIDRLKKRRCYPIPIGDDRIHLRALTIDELKTVDTLPPELAVPFAIGSALVTDAGQSELPRLPEEPSQAYAERIVDSLKDTPLDTINAIRDGIKKLNSEPPPVEDLVKN